MRLIDNWWLVLKHAWSVRILLIAAALSGLEAMLPFIGIVPLTPVESALVSFVIVFGALIARFVAQEKLSGGKDEPS